MPSIPMQPHATPPAVPDSQSAPDGAGEHRFRAIFDGEPECVKIVDNDGHLVDMNPAGLAMIEADDITQVIGRSVEQLVHADDREFYRRLHGAARNGESAIGEFRIVGLRGTMRWMEMHVAPHRDADGNIIGALSITRDVSQRVKDASALRNSEQLFRSLFEFAAVGIALVDAHRRFLRANPRFCEITGYTEAELRDRTFVDITHPDDVESNLHLVQRGEAGEIGGYRLQKRYVRKDGGIIWANLSAAIVRDEAGQILNYVAVVEDITDARHATTEVQATRALLEKAEQIAGMGSWESLADGSSSRWSNGMYRIFGITPGDPDITPQSLLARFIHPDDRAAFTRARETVVNTGQPASFECRITRVDGSQRYLHSQGTAERGPDGRVTHVVGMAQDITDRKLAELALIESRRRYDELINTIDGVVWESDAETFSLRFISRQIEALLGYPIAQWYTPGFWPTCVHPDDVDSVVARYRTAALTREAFSFEYRAVHANGQIVWVRDHCVFEVSADGHTLLRGVTVDVTERMRAESARRHSEELYRAAAEGSLDAFYILRLERDANGRPVDFRFMDANGIGLHLIGMPRERVIGARLCELIPINRTGGFFEKYVAVFESGVPIEEEFEISAPQISATWLHHQVIPLSDGVAITTRDVTERKLAEIELKNHRDRLEQLVDLRTRELMASQEQLRQAERLASIGTLAAGIAHEINNPIGAILLRAESILRTASRSPLPEPLRGAIAEIADQSRRCGRIVRNVLTFARQQSAARTDAALDAIVRQAAELATPYAAAAGASISLVLGNGETSPIVTLSQTGIEQMLVNLINNAADACAKNIVVQLGQSPGEAVIRVSDDGRGIPDLLLPRVFDPFFTTRRDCGGTGLGLSIVHGIVSDHGGHITLESLPSYGTIVTVRLPLAANYGKSSLNQHHIPFVTPSRKSPATQILGGIT